VTEEFKDFIVLSNLVFNKRLGLSIILGCIYTLQLTMEE